MVRATTRNASKAGSKEEETEDSPVEPEEGATPASPPVEATTNQENVERPSAKKTRQVRKRRRGNNGDGEEEEGSEGRKQLKRARLKSPDPTLKGASHDLEMDEEDENGDAESEADDSEMVDNVKDSKNDSEKQDDDNETEAKVEVTEKDAPVPNDTKPPTSKATAAKTKAIPPVARLRVPSQQTPGKFANDRNLRVSTEVGPPAGEMPVPTRRLVFNSTPTADQNVASATATTKSESIKKDDNKSGQNGSLAPAEESQQAEPAELGDQHGQPGPKIDYLAKSWVWFLLFLAMHVVIHITFPRNPVLPGVVNVSNKALRFYKTIYFYVFEPPKRKVVNQTMLDEIADKEQKRKVQKQQWINDLRRVQQVLDNEANKLAANAQAIDNDLNVIRSRVEERKKPLMELHGKLSQLEERINALTAQNLEMTKEGITKIKDSLGEEDRNKLLDLTSLDLWEIPEIPDKCEIEDDSSSEALSSEDSALLSVVVSERLDDWLQEVRSLVSNSTSEILEDAEVRQSVQVWIQAELKKAVDWDKSLSNITSENVTELLMKKVGDKDIATVEGMVKANSIVRQIQDRLEIEIADQTGEIDYASIRNGASVIRKGQRVTTRSLVQQLPFLNRLLAFAGLRFYGHSPEAALTPTNPPDALGQCWAFHNEEALAKKKGQSKSTQDFSRGSVATLSVRLSKPIFVHSIAIEHPPLEITDRMESAIRIFRVIGYEDATASKGSYELGRFEFRLGRCFMFLRVSFFVNDTNLFTIYFLRGIQRKTSLREWNTL